MKGMSCFPCAGFGPQPQLAAGWGRAMSGPPRFRDALPGELEVHSGGQRAGSVSIPGDTDDVVQEVFVVAHRRLPEFEGRAQVRTWLLKILVRVVRQYFRTQLRKPGHRRRHRSTTSTGFAIARPAGQQRRPSARTRFAFSDCLLDRWIARSGRCSCWRGRATFGSRNRRSPRGQPQHHLFAPACRRAPRIPTGIGALSHPRARGTP